GHRRPKASSTKGCYHPFHLNRKVPTLEAERGEAALLEVAQDCADAWVSSRAGRTLDVHVLVKQVDLVLDRFLGERELLRNRGVAETLGDQPQDFALAWGEARKRAVVARPHVADQLGVEHHHAVGRAFDGPPERLDVSDGSLQQVRPPGDRLGRQRRNELGVAVVRQQDDSDLRQGAAEAQTELDAVERTRQLDVEYGDAGGKLRYLGERSFGVAVRADDLDSRVLRQGDADQVAVEALVLHHDDVDPFLGPCPHGGLLCPPRRTENMSSRVNWSRRRKGRD